MTDTERNMYAVILLSAVTVTLFSKRCEKFGVRVDFDVR